MYNKRVLKKATDNLDKAKAPAASKDIIVDPRGQWEHPGQNTRIPSSNITMQGVNYPVLGVGSNGQQQMMYPGMEYTFPGADYVDEFPQMQMAKKGGSLKSKKYTRSLEGTNELFTENKLLKRSKSKKKKTFNPRAKDYQEGGYADDSFELDLTPEEIEEYAKGGFIIEDISVPELTKAQKGAATQADSLSLYNNALQQQAYYNTLKPYYEPVYIGPWRYTNADVRRASKDSEYYDIPSSWTAKEKENFKNFQNTIKSSNDPNVSYITDLITGALDPNAPALRYDNRIKPQGQADYIPKSYTFNKYVSPDIKKIQGITIKDRSKQTKHERNFNSLRIQYMFETNPAKRANYKKELYSTAKAIGFKNPNKAIDEWLYREKKDAELDKKLKGVNTTIPYYDPIAVKPGNMLTPAEVKERVKKYGTRGIPASKLKGIAPPIGGKNPLVTIPSGAKLGAKKKVVIDPYAHSKTNVVPTVIGTPPDQNTDPTKKHVGTNEILGYDENGNPTSRIEYIYEDVKLTKGLKDLSKFTNSVQNEIVPQTFPVRNPETSNTAFRYRDQWQHVYKPVEGGFETFGTKQATLPYGEKLGEHPWEYNKSNELPESGHHVWIVGNQKYYNEEEAKSAAEQWDKEHSYQFKQGGTLPKAQLGKNVSLTASPFSLNANAIPLASKVFGEYNPELLLGAQQNLNSPNQDFKHNATVDLGLPYTGKFAPSVNAAYHGAYDLSTPGQKLRPTVNSDLQVGYHPKQGVNFAVTANPRLEFSNVGQDTLNRKNWSRGAWKGYVGLLGSAGYRGKSFDPNDIQGIPSSWATVDPKGSNFLMGFGANAGFEARPFKKPLKLGIDASIMESHGKKAAEQTVDSSPHNYTGWTPTVNVHASYPLSELMRKKQNKTREPNLPKNRPSGVHKFKEGGIYLDLSEDEIQAYEKGGYIVERLD